jgi:UDP-GlcNAc:undecaprenyl-phosphate GlcNAc-1-phosphate transferase
MLIGATLIVVMALLDDVFNLRAALRFIIQIAAAVIVVSQGVVIERINIFDKYFEFGMFAVPLTIIWIVGLTNAVNFIDGLDGLSCGLSTISAISLFVVTLIIGEVEVAFLIAMLAGACVGFLPFNMNPAKIFAGDTGAMFLGFVLSVVSIQGVFKVHAVLTFVIPFLILGVPIFDTTFAIFRRILTGRHPFSSDRGHLHHRLVDMGFNHKQAVRILYAASALLGISSIMFVTQKIVYAIIIISISLGISVVTWIIIKNEKWRIESGLISEDALEEQKNKLSLIEPPEDIGTSAKENAINAAAESGGANLLNDGSLNFTSTSKTSNKEN